MIGARKPLLALAAALTLSACSGTLIGGGEADDLERQPFLELATATRAVIRERADDTPAAPFDPATSVGPAEVATLEARTWVANIAARDAWGTLTQAGTNQGTNTYFTLDGISVSMRRGVLVGTRGLGADLLATSPRPTLALLAAGGPGAYTRKLVFLDPTSTRQSLLLDCQFAPQGAETLTIARQQIRTQRYTETCLGAEAPVTNSFWVGVADGGVVQARQWISAEVGYLDTYLLKK